MLKTQEHYDLIAQFERDHKLASDSPLARKESKDMWPSGYVYCHGETNAQFIAYRRGYAYGKAIARDA